LMQLARDLVNRVTNRADSVGNIPVAEVVDNQQTEDGNTQTAPTTTTNDVVSSSSTYPSINTASSATDSDDSNLDQHSVTNTQHQQQQN